MLVDNHAFSMLKHHTTKLTKDKKLIEKSMQKIKYNTMVVLFLLLVNKLGIKLVYELRGYWVIDYMCF